MEREQLSWQERGQLWLRLIIRLVLAAAAVVLVAKLGPPLLSLFAPFVAALIVAALLNPAVRWLQRRLGWSRKLLSLLLVVVIFGVIGGCLGILTYAAANELVSLAQNWSGMLTQVEGFFDQMEALFARAMDLLPLSVVGTVEDTVNALIQRLQAVDPTALLSAAKAATDWAMRVPEFLLALVVFVMASYFLTADYPDHRVGHCYGALGGGGSVYPGFLHRCLSDGDLGGGGHVPPGGGATVRGRPDRPVPYPVPGGHLRGHEGGRSGWHDPGTHPHPGGAEPGRAGDLSGLLDGCDGGGPGHHGDPFPAAGAEMRGSVKVFSGIVQKIPPLSSCFLHI